MSFMKKVWKDIIAEYPNRRTLTDSNNNTSVVFVTRSVGTVSQEGDAWNAQNMNDMEQRIEDGFNSVGGVNEFVITTASWTASEADERYPYESVVITSLYSDDMPNADLLVIPMEGVFETEAESESKALLYQYVNFTSASFTVYASDVPSVPLKLRVIGGK